MAPSVFKKTYYLGLSIILTPIIFFSLILFSIFVVGSSNKNSEIKPKKEIVVETKTIIVRDTVFIKKPTVSPKTSTEPKIDDTIKKLDTFNPQKQ